MNKTLWCDIKICLNEISFIISESDKSIAEYAEDVYVKQLGRNVKLERVSKRNNHLIVEYTGHDTIWILEEVHKNGKCVGYRPLEYIDVTKCNRVTIISKLCYFVLNA